MPPTAIALVFVAALLGEGARGPCIVGALCVAAGAAALALG